jgi:HPt (histidine-containing phosphotransfer) domain-containing protein
MRDVNILKKNGIDVDAGVEILGDMEMYDETLQDFLDESEVRLPSLLEARNSGDMENYAILVHAMKGDSKYLGFTKLAELSYDHQLKSQERDSSYVNAHFDELMKEACRVINAVKEYLGK